MSRKLGTRIVASAIGLCLICLAAWYAIRETTNSHSKVLQNRSEPEAKGSSQEISSSQVDPLEQRFSNRVQPFLNRYCFPCHGSKKPKADLDLTRDATVAAIAKNVRQWELVLE